MVILSSHNLRELDDCLSEVEKEVFALHALMEYEVTDPDRRCNFNFWLGLLFDHIGFLDQHVSDLRHLDGCFRQEREFNLDDSELPSNDPFFGDTKPEVIHDFAVSLMLLEDGLVFDRDSIFGLLLHRIVKECFSRDPGLEEVSDHAVQ